MSKEAERLESLVASRAGRKYFLLKCILLLLALNLLTAFLIVTVATLTGENLIAIEEVRRNVSSEPNPSRQDFMYLSWVLLASAVVPNIILDSIALICSIFVFQTIARHRNPFVVVPLTLLDVIVVASLTAIVYQISEVSFWGAYVRTAKSVPYTVLSVSLSAVSDADFHPRYLLNAVRGVLEWSETRRLLSGTRETMLEGNWDFITLYPAARFTLLTLTLVSVVPTAIHFLLLSLFVVSKMTRFVLEPLTSFVFVRLYSDERSVLTISALVIGTIAKLLQELWKAIS